jgi:hypothetical protein
MIRLGTYDVDSMPADRRGYFRGLHEPVMLARLLFRGERVGQWHKFSASGGRDVAKVQEILKTAGFMPLGKVDGLCGYRTASAIRLFQEYVRSVEGDDSIGTADGVLGQRSRFHLDRWKTDGHRAEWMQFSGDNPGPEYRKWMKLLKATKSHYRQSPTTLLKKVAEFERPSDTRKVSDWRFDTDDIHLIGIRRDEAQPGQRTNDDVFVLLVHGVVFKFFGTTDPGKSSHRDGAPFLVPGQHRYRFGWHKQSDQEKVCRALKPETSGVLIIRDSDRDMALTHSDLEGRLERNPGINVHWGGRGVSNWSQGCQVICGKGYINHRNEKLDCSAFAATTYANLGKKVGGVYQTKGAYSVLVDLVTALSGDQHSLSYMLLYEKDLGLTPAIESDVAAKVLAQVA